MEARPGHSGAFEVSVDGELLHSKINGEGYVNGEKMHKLAAFISNKGGK